MNCTIKFAAADGSSISTKIRRFEEHVRLNAKHWVGSDEEFTRWAEAGMARLLENLAAHFTVELSDVPARTPAGYEIPVERRTS
jgi:hypothetical protein